MLTRQKVEITEKPEEMLETLGFQSMSEASS